MSQTSGLVTQQNLKLQEMIDSHWKYIAGVLKVHNESEDVIETCKYHYKSAFQHGWKHAMEEVESNATLVGRGI